MLNLDAVRRVRDLFDWLLVALENESDEKIYEEFRRLILEWSLRPELESTLAMAVKSWLEARPDSTLARTCLKTLLSLDGYLVEAAEVEAGGPPRPLMPPEVAVRYQSERKERIAQELLNRQS